MASFICASHRVALRPSLPPLSALLTRPVRLSQASRFRPCAATYYSFCQFSSSADDAPSNSQPAGDGLTSKSKSALLHSLQNLTDEEVVDFVNAGKISQYRLERELKHAIEAGNHPDCERAVRIRRIWLQSRVRQAAERAGKKPSSTRK